MKLRGFMQGVWYGNGGAAQWMGGAGGTQSLRSVAHTLCSACRCRMARSPEPVLARAMMSLPAMAGSNTVFWMANREWMPLASRAEICSGEGRAWGGPGRGVRGREGDLQRWLSRGEGGERDVLRGRDLQQQRGERGPEGLPAHLFPPPAHPPLRRSGRS